MTWPIFVEPGSGQEPGGGGPPIFPIYPPDNGGGPVLTPVGSGGPVTVITPGNPPVVVNPRTGAQLPSDTPTTTTVTVHPDGTQTLAPTVAAGGIGDLLNMQIFGIPAWIVGLGVLILVTGKK